MYQLRRDIENLADRTVNENIFVKDRTVYIENKFKYHDDNWYENADGNWINLQGGIPDYRVETNLDPDIFVEENK